MDYCGENGETQGAIQAIEKHPTASSSLANGKAISSTRQSSEAWLTPGSAFSEDISLTRSDSNRGRIHAFSASIPILTAAFSPRDTDSPLDNEMEIVVRSGAIILVPAICDSSEKKLASSSIITLYSKSQNIVTDQDKLEMASVGRDALLSNPCATTALSVKRQAPRLPLSVKSLRKQMMRKKNNASWLGMEQGYHASRRIRAISKP